MPIVNLVLVHYHYVYNDNDNEYNRRRYYRRLFVFRPRFLPPLTFCSAVKGFSDSTDGRDDVISDIGFEIASGIMETCLLELFSGALSMLVLSFMVTYANTNVVNPTKKYPV
jgi:hypothetical protein